MSGYYFIFVEQFNNFLFVIFLCVKEFKENIYVD